MTPAEIWSRCRPEGECLLWVGPENKDGTPRLRLGGRYVQTRRLLMEALGMPVPDGCFACASCANRLCMAEGHLAALNQSQMQLHMRRPKSTTAMIVKAVIGLGRASLDDIAPMFPGCERAALSQALRNAGERGLLRRVQPATRLPVCEGGSLPIWGPPGGEREEVTIRPPASVWELAHCRQIPGEWPPAYPTGRAYLLADEEDAEPSEAGMLEVSAEAA